MSYERRITTKDGEEVIQRDDPEDRSTTKGTLSHSVGADNKAAPNHSDHEGHLFTSDQETMLLLQDILKELKKMNIYNAMVHDYQVTDKDLGDN